MPRPLILLLLFLLVKHQVELMMKFDHPNLVKAYHYVTWGSAGVSVRLTRVRSNSNGSCFGLFPVGFCVYCTSSYYAASALCC
jgi:hypothetical protein